MGIYLRENYPERIKLDGYELPCACLVEVSGGGKKMVIHNNIKEVTGYEDKKLKIFGRMEGETDEDLQSQIKAIMALAQKEKALTIVSKEADAHNIKKIAIQNNPQITLIDGYELSRNLVMEGLEDTEDETSFNLAQEKKENIERITDQKKKEKERIHIVASGEALYKIAVRYYGNYRRWKAIHRANPWIKDPDKIYPGDKLKIPNLSTSSKEVTVKAGDSVALIAHQNGLSKAELKKHNSGKKMVAGETLYIPPEQTEAEKSFAGSIS